MKELFEDFDISNCANAFFSIELNDEGVLKYVMYDRETESNSLYLVHKESKTSFTFDSAGDSSDLSEYNEAWLSCDKDIESFKKMFSHFVD